ncbi:MAG TPA: hypothetical protein EYO53_06040 [Alphaproteobacteria bacterium]|jgi:hypothetical protein|nr:hypothetical protein [Alphaproteobacteria bacterium]
MSDGPVEIPESEATGTVRELYDDMKATMNIGMINLIYRRMATADGLLEWVWDAVRPVLASGDVERAALLLESGLDWPSMPEIPAPALPLLGLGSPEIDTLIRVLDDYNRGNSLNLFLLTAFAERLKSGGSWEEVPDATVDVPSAKPQDLPPIVAMSDMSKETASLVRVLSAPISLANKPMIPSLFRHLARWPGYLALVSPHIIHMIGSGKLSTVSSIVRNRAIGFAPDLGKKIRVPVGLKTPGEAIQAYWLDQWQSYTSKPIPEMIVIGYALRHALPTA